MPGAAARPPSRARASVPNPKFALIVRPSRWRASGSRGTLGRGLNCSQRNAHGGKLDEGEEGCPELVVAGGDAPELLQLVEEALDLVAVAVERLAPAEALLAVRCVGNVRDRALRADQRPNAVGVVALVGDDDGTPLETLEQRLRAGGVVVLSRRDQQPDRPALRVDARVDLRGEASATSPNTTNSTLFLTPEAC